MGVLKNEVGRPSNKTIKTRFILKLIGLISAITLCFIIGYKLSGNKSEIKEKLLVGQEYASNVNINLLYKLISNEEEFRTLIMLPLKLSNIFSISL